MKKANETKNTNTETTKIFNLDSLIPKSKPAPKFNIETLLTK